MAIDTRNKRGSAVGMVSTTIYPNPDGTIIAADREQITRLYAGIAAGGGPTPPPPPASVTGRKGKFLVILQAGGN